MSKGLTMNVEWTTRLCTVGDRTGYFHTWEHFSKPLEASPLIGGAPAGVFSKVFGIVEFPDGVERVDPADIHLCDEENEMLKNFPRRKTREEKMKTLQKVIVQRKEKSQCEH